MLATVTLYIKTNFATKLLKERWKNLLHTRSDSVRKLADELKI